MTSSRPPHFRWRRNKSRHLQIDQQWMINGQNSEASEARICSSNEGRQGLRQIQNRDRGPTSVSDDVGQVNAGPKIEEGGLLVGPQDERIRGKIGIIRLASCGPPKLGVSFCPGNFRIMTLSWVPCRSWIRDPVKVQNYGRM